MIIFWNFKNQSGVLYLYGHFRNPSRRWKGGHRWEVWGQKMNIVIIKHALKLLQGQKCPLSHGIKEPKEKTSSRNLKTIQLFGGRSKWTSRAPAGQQVSTDVTSTRQCEAKIKVAAVEIASLHYKWLEVGGGMSFCCGNYVLYQAQSVIPRGRHFPPLKIAITLTCITYRRILSHYSSHRYP